MSAAKIMMKPLAPATNTSARNILAAAGGGNHHHWTPVARATMSAFGHRASSVSSGASSDGGSGSGSMVPEKPKRKRQRLDHLTQEEKIMRRKLKNRMAAQSARDRKKMKMQDLEGESKELRKANEMLTKRNALLTKRVRLLELENEALRGQLLGADMVPATVAASAADSDSAEENMLQLMASFAQEAKHQHDDEEEYDDEDEDEEMMDAKEEEDDDEEQWSDAEEDLLHRQMISGGEMMMEGNESDNSSDVSDDSGLVLTTAAAAPTASVDSTSAAKSSAKSKAAAGSRVPPLEPQGRSRVAVAASQSIESAAGSGLPGSGVQARTTKGATAAGAAAGGRRRRGGCRGGRGGVPEVEVKQQRQQQQSGALHGHHLNVLNGAVQQQQPKQQHQLPRGGGGGLSAANQQQQQQQQQGCLTTVGAAAEEQLLLNDLNIAPSEIDELLDSLVQSYDEQSFLQYGCAGGVAADIEAAVSDAFCFGEQTNYSSSSTDGDEAAAEADAAPFDPDSLLNSFPLGAVSGSVQQLFASIDESTLEFTAGGGGSQSGGRQSGLLASSLALGGAATGAKGAGAASAARSLNIGSSSSSNDSRSSSPEFRHGSLHVDHDYAATLIKVVSPTADLNNNNLDLLDSLLTSTTSFPVSPLSSSSLADIGYESGVASPVGSDGGISNCNNNSSNGCFGGSPLLSSSTGSAGLLFDHQDQASIDEQEMMKLMDDLTEDRLFGDGFIGSGLASSSLMASDPMLIDATFLERYPEMF